MPKTYNEAATPTHLRLMLYLFAFSFRLSKNKTGKIINPCNKKEAPVKRLKPAKVNSENERITWFIPEGMNEAKYNDSKRITLLNLPRYLESFL
jgi:hypothetical protein